MSDITGGGGDYFMYNFETSSKAQRKAIVPYREMFVLYRKVNTRRAWELLTDKFETYKLFKKYYKRDVCLYKPGYEEDFDKFIESNTSFIVKPLNSLCGFGIKIYRFEKDDIQSGKRTVIDENPGGFVAEGLIMQSPEMGILHPSSVNTLRINTVKYSDHSEVIVPCIRMGQNGNIVDNAGSGGIFAAVNKDTGVTVAACDEHCHIYSHHPDTNVPLVGFNVPHWSGAVQLPLELSEVLPENHITGWDLALTEDGWVMVEGNTRPLFIYQIATQDGLRPEYERIMAGLSR